MAMLDFGFNQNVRPLKSVALNQGRTMGFNYPWIETGNFFPREKS
jgi:hypothetical protein